MMMQANQILISQMTTTEVQNLMTAGYNSVILTSGAMEQHGPHLPIHTDTTIAEALALQAAVKIGKTLVAPVINIGCSEHHMAFCGTISLPKDVFIANLKGSIESLKRHGFQRILVTSFHGGNFAPSAEAVEEMQRVHPDLDIRSALDLQGLLQVNNGVIAEFFPDRRELLDAHAGCVETSMMLFLNPGYVREECAQDGVRLTRLPPFDDLSQVTENGVLGLVNGYSSQIGESLFDALVEFLLKSWGIDLTT